MHFFYYTKNGKFGTNQRRKLLWDLKSFQLCIIMWNKRSLLVVVLYKEAPWGVSPRITFPVLACAWLSFKLIVLFFTFLGWLHISVVSFHGVTIMVLLGFITVGSYTNVFNLFTQLAQRPSSRAGRTGHTFKDLGSLCLPARLSFSCLFHT